MYSDGSNPEMSKICKACSLPLPTAHSTLLSVTRGWYLSPHSLWIALCHLNQQSLDSKKMPILNFSLGSFWDLKLSFSMSLQSWNHWFKYKAKQKLIMRSPWTLVAQGRSGGCKWPCLGPLPIHNHLVCHCHIIWTTSQPNLHYSFALGTEKRVILCSDPW